MDSMDAKCITKNLIYIKDNITQLEKVIDKLIEDDCLAMDERESILASKTSDKQVQRLLDILLKRGRRAYGCFITALEVSGNQHIANKIKHTEGFTDERGNTFTQEDGYTVKTRIEFDEFEVLQLFEEKELYLDRVKELEINCKILQNENRFKDRAIERLKEDMHTLKEKASAGYDEFDNAAKTTCADYENMMKEFEMKCKALEEENSHLQIVQRSLQETISEKEITMKNLSEERNFYKKQTDNLQSEIDKLKKDNCQKDVKIKALMEQIRQLRTELQNTRRVMDKMANDSHNAMEQMKTDHAKRFNQLDSKLDCVLKMLLSSKVAQDKTNAKSADPNRVNRRLSLASNRTERSTDKNLPKPKQNK